MWIYIILSQIWFQTPEEATVFLKPMGMTLTRPDLYDFDNKHNPFMTNAVAFSEFILRKIVWIQELITKYGNKELLSLDHT